MTVLLDANVLIALLVPDHIHHARVTNGVDVTDIATCPITQGAFVRFALRNGAAPPAAAASLASLTNLTGHRFVPDDLPFADIRWRRVIGHRQVTDAYLAALARHHAMTLLTLDEGLAELHDDVARLVTSSGEQHPDVEDDEHGQHGDDDAGEHGVAPATGPVGQPHATKAPHGQSEREDGQGE